MLSDIHKFLFDTFLVCLCVNLIKIQFTFLPVSELFTRCKSTSKKLFRLKARNSHIPFRSLWWLENVAKLKKSKKEKFDRNRSIERSSIGDSKPIDFAKFDGRSLMMRQKVLNVLSSLASTGWTSNSFPNAGRWRWTRIVSLREVVKSWLLL